jgi:hypothetical protein
MKYIFSFFLIAFCCALPTSVFADRQMEDWLHKLDESLANREKYEQKRVERINNLKEMMDYAKTHGKEFEQLYGLYNE